MTPEAVESRLRSLRTPQPPKRLRERCLAPHRGSRRPQVAFAVAASFLVVGLSVWLIATQKPSVRRPDQILPPDAAQSPLADDPVLRDKVDRLFRENPTKGILVVRVKQLREGTFWPVTRGFGMKILLEPVNQNPDPRKEADGPHAEVDLDGTLLFVVSPGHYRGVGYQRFPGAEFRDLSFAWEYKDVDVQSGGVLLLSDGIVAPWMEWAGPAEGSEVSLKADLGISWAAYSEVREVRVGIERVTDTREGIISRTPLGILRRECPKENSIALSELMTVSRTAFRAGETLAVSLEGYGRGGKKV